MVHIMLINLHPQFQTDPCRQFVCGYRSVFLLLLVLVLAAFSASDVRAQAGFQAAGTQQSGTGAVVVPWPAHQAGDIAFLFVESRQTEAATLSTPAGFAAVTNSPQFTASDAAAPNTGTRLTVFWARATSAAMASPTVADPGDHVYARILTYRRAISSGTPWDVTGGGAESGANNTTLTVTGVTTTVANTRVIQAASRNNDSAAAGFSAQTNAGLTGIAERSDAGTTSGDGGGIGVWDGLRAVAGATGNTTVTVTSSVNAFLTIALRPATTYYSRASTGWSVGTTWSTEGCNGVPASAAPYAGSDVVVCDGHTVTLDANSANLNSLTIQNTGVLNIGNSATARTLTVSPALPSPPGTIVNDGTIRYNTAGNHAITTNGTFTNNDTFTSAAGIAGTRTLTATGLITNTGTFRINGTAATTINANGGFTNDGTFDVDPASNLTHTFNVRSTFTNNGTVQFRPDANSLVTTNFTTGAPVVGSVLTGSAGSTTFYNATVNNSGGLTLSGTHNMNVLNVLTLTTGPIITNANYVYVASTSAIGSVGGNDFVIGNLRMNFNAGANISRTFAVGSGLTPAARYTPVSIRFGSVTATGDFTVSTTGADHPQIGTSPVNPAQSVNRYWTLTNNSVGFQSVNANNRVIFTYVTPADIDAGVTTPFVVGRYNAPTWTSITPTVAVPNVTLPAAAVTNATMAGTADYVVGEAAPVVPAPGDFNAFETSTAANQTSGRIFTKLVGSNFSLDIVAILALAQHATFTNTVAVDLVTGSTGGLNCPGASVAAIAGTSQNVNLTTGRGTTAAFNVAGTAYPDVRVRVRFPVGAPTVISCSTDNFSIRPTGFTVTSTDATQTGATGTPVIKTGANFNLTATALPGYDGTPSINNTLVTGTPTAGVIGGSFTAAPSATGVAAGNSFFYSEVGNFGLLTDAIQDSGFVIAADQGGGDCIASSTSNTLSGGKYGCLIGSTAVLQSTGVSGFGRFIPDNFNVIYNLPVITPACGAFSYVGQSFNYSTAPVMTITARNGTNNGLTNATTVNYAGSYAKFTNAQLAVAPYDTKAGRYLRFDALGGGNTPDLDRTGLPDPVTTDPVIGTFTAGVGTFTFSGGTGFGFTRSATTPSAAFNADIALTLNVVDTDSVVFAGNPASFGAASAGGGMLFSDGIALTSTDKSIRYGRLRIGGASGSQVLPLRLPVEAQYWNGTAFVTNTLDSCTTLVAGNVGLFNYGGSLNAGETTASIVNSPLQSGRSAIRLSAPGATNAGSVDVTLNLGGGATADACPAFAPAATAGNKSHLRGRWCNPPGTYVKDPSAKARFGVMRGSDQPIYRREQ